MHPAALLLTTHAMRVALVLPKALLDFLDEQSRISGIDRSNLIRAKLLEWMQAERDRRIAEAKAGLPVGDGRLPRGSRNNQKD